MRAMTGIVLTTLFAGALAAGGCERTVAENEKVTYKRDGTVKVDRETVKERPDGTRVYERETGVDVDPD